MGKLNKKAILYPDRKQKLYKIVNGKPVYQPDFEIIKDKNGKVIDMKDKKID